MKISLCFTLPQSILGKYDFILSGEWCRNECIDPLRYASLTSLFTVAKEAKFPYFAKVKPVSSWLILKSSYILQPLLWLANSCVCLTAYMHSSHMGCVPVRFFMSFTRKHPSVSFTRITCMSAHYWRTPYNGLNWNVLSPWSLRISYRVGLLLIPPYFSNKTKGCCCCENSIDSSNGFPLHHV